MTKSRISTHRLLLGYLGRDSRSAAALKYWNAVLKKRGVDGSMDRYPCTPLTVPERLSEMLHFDRRGYIVSAALQHSIAPLMDHLDASTKKRGVDTIVNDGGVFTGYWTDNNDDERWKLWFG